MNVGGIVLCGGRSSRMGRPKAWLPFGNELLLPRIVRVLREVVDPVVVVAAPSQDVPPLPPGVEIVRDAEEGHGPLQGLAAGLAALDGRVDAAYLSACDAPFLRAPFVQRVIECLESGDSRGRAEFLYDIAVPKIGSFFHPLAGAYRLGVREEVVRLLAANERRMSALFGVARTRVLGPDDFATVDPTYQSLRNMNTAAEYDAAVGELEL